MTIKRFAHTLNFSRAAMLIATGLVAVAVPIAFGQASATQGTAAAQAASTAAAAPALAFDIASIKPDKSTDGMSRLGLMPGSNFVATNVSPLMLIRMAYGVEDNQISGAPSWLSSQRYDIEAKPNEFEADQLQKLSPQDRSAAVGQMIQALLADRFKLTLHHETKELPEYVLVVAKNGPKMQEAKPDDTYPNGFKGPDGRPGAGMMRMMPGQITAQGVVLANLVRTLSAQLGSTVIDKTGLTGKYDFTLQWSPDMNQPSTMTAGGAGGQGPGAAAPADSSGPSIFTALEEQLGLKLESQKGPVDILVIAHVEEPSEN
jgi:bla regulator protein blaR1